MQVEEKIEKIEDVLNTLFKKYGSKRISQKGDEYESIDMLVASNEKIWQELKADIARFVRLGLSKNYDYWIYKKWLMRRPK